EAARGGAPRMRPRAGAPPAPVGRDPGPGRSRPPPPPSRRGLVRKADLEERPPSPREVVPCADLREDQLGVVQKVVQARPTSALEIRDAQLVPCAHLGR